MNTEKLNTKILLSETAIDLYLADKYSIPALIDETGKTASEIYALFPNKKSILKFYYPSLVIRYRFMIEEIEDFDTYTISEKISNFMFTLFDMMEERREFVARTFSTFEWKTCKKTDFQKEVESLFRDFFTSDPNVANSAAFVIGDVFYASLKTQYLYLIKFWLEDETPGQERTFALIDKITGFIEELVYSKIADKGFDLIKYTVNISGFGSKMEDLNSWISQWFEEEKYQPNEDTEEKGNE